MTVKSYIPNEINLSDEANNYLQIQSKTNFIKMGLKPSGCSGFKYTVKDIHPDDIDDETSTIFLFDPLYLVINNNDLQNFKGMKLDYKKSGLNGELVFENPNTHDECGCGESFSLKK